MNKKISLLLIGAYLALTLGCGDLKQHKNWGLLTSYDGLCGISSPKSSAYIESVTDISPRILSGTRLKVGELPWMMRVKHFHDGISDACGGSIISSRYILTAAHCCVSKEDPTLVHRPDDVKVFHQQPKKDDWFWKRHQVESLTPHQNFELNMGDHDICLIRLENELKFDEQQKPICLPTACEFEKNDCELTVLSVAGWGLNNDGGKLTTDKTLRNVTVLSTSRLECERIWKMQISSNKICTLGHDKRNKNVLVGPSNDDSGGPLMHTTMSNGKERSIAIGVVSFKGHTDGIGNWTTLHRDLPLINTRVAPYIKWILDNIQP